MEYISATDGITLADAIREMGYEYDPTNEKHLAAFLDSFLIPAFWDGYDAWKAHKTRTTAWKVKRQTSGKKCHVCGNDAEVCHHILLVALGGDNSEENITYLCKKCHKAIHEAKAYDHEAFESFVNQYNIQEGRP